MADIHHMIRFRDHELVITDTDECILWPLAAGTNGYGYRWLTVDGKRKGVLAHRYVYELVHGPIPEGQVIDHLCRVRMCVNPRHLEPVTQATNNDRMREHLVQKSVCKHGHDLTLPGAVVPYGNMLCRECRNAAARRYRKKHATKVNAYLRTRREKRRLDPSVSGEDLVVGGASDTAS